jgi:polyferredoxin
VGHYPRNPNPYFVSLALNEGSANADSHRMKKRPPENQARKRLVTSGILGAIGLLSAYVVAAGQIYNVTSGSAIGMYATMLLIMAAFTTLLAALGSLIAGVRARRPAAGAIDTIAIDRGEDRKAA